MSVREAVLHGRLSVFPYFVVCVRLLLCLLKFAIPDPLFRIFALHYDASVPL